MCLVKECGRDFVEWWSRNKGIHGLLLVLFPVFFVHLNTKKDDLNKIHGFKRYQVKVKGHLFPGK